MRKNKKYLDFIRSKPCECGLEAEPHHIRDISMTPKKLRGGVGLKPSDYMSVPRCRECHELAHNYKQTTQDDPQEIILLLAEYVHTRDK